MTARALCSACGQELSPLASLAAPPEHCPHCRVPLHAASEAIRPGAGTLFRVEWPPELLLGQRPCPHCGRSISERFLFCPHCEEPVAADPGALENWRAWARRHDVDIFLAWLGAAALTGYGVVGVCCALNGELQHLLILSVVLLFFTVVGLIAYLSVARLQRAGPGAVVFETCQHIGMIVALFLAVGVICCCGFLLG